MNGTTYTLALEGAMKVSIDKIQERLASYACELNFDGLNPQTVHAAKVRVIDTLGALIAGFDGEPCKVLRSVAAQNPHPRGATVIGTQLRTTLEMAAFANATTACYAELSDTYYATGSFGGHPSDVLTPLLAAAEGVRASGKEFITSVVLAYEIYLRLNHVFHNMGFDHTNFSCLATAVAAGKLLNLSREQLLHCISIAAVPNNALRQSRVGFLSMWKAAASGYAGRAGVFSAVLAQAGMEGPHLPFEGAAGWCNHIALERFSLDIMGGKNVPFKILDTSIKLRPCSGLTLAAVTAAEKIVPLRDPHQVKRIVVEVNKKAKELVGTHAHHWEPNSRESADHSAPYLVAATLIDGIITPRSFDDAHISNAKLRALMQKIEVIENPEFTIAYDQTPSKHLARVTVTAGDDTYVTGSSGGGEDDLSAAKSNVEIEGKFRTLTEDRFGTERVSMLLKTLWDLTDLRDIAVIPSALEIDALAAGET